MGKLLFSTVSLKTDYYTFKKVNADNHLSSSIFKGVSDKKSHLLMRSKDHITNLYVLLY